MTKAFIDESIFQGITEYRDEIGNLWQRHDNDSWAYKFYKQESNGGAYIYEGSLAKNNIKGKTISFIHRAFLDQ